MLELRFLPFKQNRWEKLKWGFYDSGRSLANWPWEKVARIFQRKPMITVHSRWGGGFSRPWPFLRSFFANNLYIKSIINFEKKWLIHKKLINRSIFFAKIMLWKTSQVMERFWFFRAKAKISTFFFPIYDYFPPQKRSMSNRVTPKLIKSGSFKEKIFNYLIISLS